MYKTLFQSPTMVHERSKTHLHHELPDTQMLKMEAEKIRQWQVQTEMNTKKMEKQVQNLRKTVESQRKSLLEVQLEYESVGNKMQEEINKRAFCFQKIEATRDMCSLLKNQACDLEKTLNFCDTIKDDLGFKYTQNNSSIEKLTVEFEQLCKDSERAKESFTIKLTECQSKHELEKQTILEEIEKQKYNLSKCQQNLQQNEIVVDILTSCLVKLQDFVAKQFKSKEQLSTNNIQLLKKLSASNLRKLLLQSIVKDQTVLRERRENELRVVDKMLKNADSVCNDFQEKIKLQTLEASEMSTKNEKLESELETAVATIRELKQQIEEKNAELQVHSEKFRMLIVENEDMKLQTLQLSEHKRLILEKQQQDDKEISRCNSLIFQNKALINKLLEESALAKDAKEKQIQELKTSSDENKHLLKTLKNLETENSSLKQQIEVAQLAVEASNIKVDSCHKDQSILRLDLNKQISENSELKKELEELRRLKSAAAKYEELQIEFDGQSKKLAEAQKSYSEINKTVQDQEKQLEECNESLSKLKHVVEEQTKSISASSRLYNELLIIRNDQTQELNTLYRDLQNSKDSLVLEKQNNQLAVEKLQKEHKEEIRKIENKLQSLNDKLEIKKEAEIKKNVVVEPLKKRSKRGHFSPLAHDVSMGGRDLSSTTIFSLLAEKQINTKQPAPKHCSTPIQKTPKPGKYASIRSSKKTFWKRATPRVITKTSCAQRKKEDNWFDTDNVYGFFE